MVRTLVKALGAIVLVSILVVVAYYSYIHYQCQAARDRYEQAALDTLSVPEITRYLTEYQQACDTQ